MIDSRVLFSFVLTVSDTFCAFGTANKGLEYQQVAIKPDTNMAVLAWLWNVCAIFIAFHHLCTYYGSIHALSLPLAANKPLILRTMIVYCNVEKNIYIFSAKNPDESELDEALNNVVSTYLYS